MRYELNVNKLHIALCITGLFLIASLFLVYGYGTSNPNVFGHSAQEFDLIVPGNVNPISLDTYIKSFNFASSSAAYTLTIRNSTLSSTSSTVSCLTGEKLVSCGHRCTSANTDIVSYASSNNSCKWSSPGSGSATCAAYAYCMKSP